MQETGAGSREGGEGCPDQVLGCKREACQSNTWGVAALGGGGGVRSFGRQCVDCRGGGAELQEGGLPEQFVSVSEQSWGGSFSV